MVSGTSEKHVECLGASSLLELRSGNLNPLCLRFSSVMGLTVALQCALHNLCAVLSPVVGKF